MALRLTNEEIARQFELPERKSKLASLFKKDVFISCICESQGSSLFVVVCDVCGKNYHGHCIGMSEREYKNIERYCCPKCLEEDPSLSSVFVDPKKSSASKSKRSSLKKIDHTLDPEYMPSKKVDKNNMRLNKNICGTCKNCNRTSDCGECITCKSLKNLNSRRKEKCINRICVTLRQSSYGSNAELSHSDEEENYVSLPVGKGRQCYGPGCIQSASANSKYCSDKCGMKLATNRILQILPQRLQEWSMTSSRAESVDKKALEDIRMRQVQTQASLQELDQRSIELEAVIAKGKELKPLLQIDVAQEKKLGKRINQLFLDDKEDSSTYCVTCGQEIHTSSAVKHMEKCFIKYESQSSFGSMYKTRPEGNNIFCDFFNAATKTYCKRLRVLCPEHRKEAAAKSDEACGCPLTKDVFQDTQTQCLLPKKYCLKHYSWEKVRRADIDLERVRYWLQMEELLQTEARIRWRMSQRGGVLSLLLHSTYDHEALEEMTAAQEAERLDQLESTLRQNYGKQQFQNISKEHKKFIKSIEQSVSS